MKQRSLLIFEDSIKSAVTRKNYLEHMNWFLAFTKIRDYDSLIKISTDQLQTMIEDYVMYLKKRISPNSVPVYMTGIKHFFIMNRVHIYWDIIQKMYPAQVKKSGQKPWTDKQVSQMIEYNTSKRNKAIIHLMASTGARIGIHSYPLQMKHLRDMGDGCMSVLIYADEIDEYWAFLTPEATTALNDYFDQRKENLEKFYPDSPIFRKSYQIGIQKAVQIPRNAVMSMIFRSIKKAGIKRTRVNRNYDTQMDHGFRKRFNTILKLENDLNSNIAEKIMGHKNGLDGVYFVPTIQQCFSEFRKAIPNLTVSDSARKQALLDIVTKEKTELENANVTVEKLQKQFTEFKKEYEMLRTGKYDK